MIGELKLEIASLRSEIKNVKESESQDDELNLARSTNRRNS